MKSKQLEKLANLSICPGVKTNTSFNDYLASLLPSGTPAGLCQHRNHAWCHQQRCLIL